MITSFSGKSTVPNGGPEAAWLRRCGEVLTTAGVRNPLLAPWWVDAVIALGPLGRPREAAALAEEYDELCRRWNTPRSLGFTR